MATIPTNTDYTDRDFESIRLRLQGLIRSVFPTWTDFAVANFGNILLDEYAFVLDVLGFYQDRQARESRITSATQRKNLLALSRLIGYVPSGATAATTDLTFTLDAPPLASVTIEKGTLVSTPEVVDSVTFELLEDVVIAAGANPPVGSGAAENSLSQEDDYASTGLADQEVLLGSTPYLDGSAAVTAANGTFDQVDNFLNSGSTDLHFQVIVDQNDRATIRFGDGVNGAIPTGTITVLYKTGGGTSGNVDADTLTRVSGNFFDTGYDPDRLVGVTVTNAEAATGGAERQSVEQIREQAPESIRVINRTVSREDYEINAQRLGSVARALMLTSNEDNTIAENSGILYIVPEGGGTASSQTIADALNQVTVVYPNTLTFSVDVQSAQYLDVDVTATVFLREGQVASLVKAEIESALEGFFDLYNEDGTQNEDVDFGFNYKDEDGNPIGEIAFSDLYNVVRDVSGVRKIGDGDSDFLINGESSDLDIGLKEFPRLGTVTLVNGSTGLPL